MTLDSHPPTHIHTHPRSHFTQSLVPGDRPRFHEDLRTCVHLSSCAQHTELSSPPLAPPQNVSDVSADSDELESTNRLDSADAAVAAAAAAAAAEPATPCRKSKHRGVSWHQFHRVWRVRLTVRGKQLHVGTFQSERAAGHAYDKAVRENFPDRQRTWFGFNFPDDTDDVRGAHLSACRRVLSQTTHPQSLLYTLS